MVRVTNVHTRTNKQGESFIALELTGSLELIQSTSSGKFFATARRCSIPSTFTEDVAKLMIGSTVDGEIVRVPCNSYEYKVQRTGETISLAYSYAYQPAGSTEVVGHGEVEIEESRPSSSKSNSAGIMAAANRGRKTI